MPPVKMRQRPPLTSLLAVVAALGAGCPKPPVNSPRRVSSTVTLAARLVLPPDEGADRALVELRRRVAAGDRAAAWEVAHYLFDLFDFARLTGDPAARAWLWKALSLPGTPGRGVEPTRRVLDRLEGLVKGLQENAERRPPTSASEPARASGGGATAAGATPRGSGPARAAALLPLLTSDRAFLAEPAAFPKRVAVLRAARRGPLGYAAELRLYAVCAQAFRAAVLAPPDERPRVLNHCLYALFEVDPTPHIRPGARIPDPPWSAYQVGLAALLDRVADAGHRPAELASRLLARDRRFYAASLQALPLSVGEQVTGLPALPGGRPWAGGAAVLRLADQLVVGGRGMLRPEARDMRVALSRLFFSHGQRTHLTLFAPGDLDVRLLKELLERAADTGFYTLGLGGGRALESREGYWTVTERRPVELREMVVSLAPSSEAARTLTTLTREELLWDRDCARHGLGLILRPGEVLAAGPDGRLEPVRPTGAYAEAAVGAAVSLQRAFPGACGLWVAAEPGVSFAELFGVVERLSRRDRPELLAFRYLGLQLETPPLPASGNAFPQRVHNRLKAQVNLGGWPKRLAASGPVLEAGIRPCYLDALDTLPTRWARLEVVSTSDKTLVSQQRGTSPEEERLNSCVVGAVEAWRRGQDSLGPLRFQVNLRP